MNESHINRINELLGESVIYEAKKMTKIKLSLDDGSNKEMDFDGSLNDAKKKYSGKKVKTIRKSKSGDIIGEAVIVNVEELNESYKTIAQLNSKNSDDLKQHIKDLTEKESEILKERKKIKKENLATGGKDFDSRKFTKLGVDLNNVIKEIQNAKYVLNKRKENGGINESETSVVNKFPGMLENIKKALKNPTFSKGPIEFAFPESKYFSKDVVKAFQKYFEDKGYKVEIGSDYPNVLYFDRKVAEKLTESKELIPFGYFKITYSDGSSKKTQARAKTAEDFKKYLTQDGDTLTDEDDDGKETKKKIVKVEKLDEAANSGKKLIKITYEIWDEDSLEAGETDDKGWEDEEGEEFESDEDGTAAEKAIKFLKKKDATNASDGSYQSGTWYQDDGDTDMKTGDKKYLAYHLHGSWTPEEKKEIYKGVTNKKINESMDTEVHTFETPMDMFRQIVKESQAIYIKEKNGKIEGRYNPKPKKDWILVDGFTASKAVKLYEAATEEQKAKIDKLSLTRFLNAIWK